MSIRGRLVLSHFVLVLAVVFLIGAVVVGRVRGYIVRSAQIALIRQAEQVALVVDPATASTRRVSGIGIGPLARLVSRLTSADFLIVDTEGLVVASSERMEPVLGSIIRSEFVDRALSEVQSTSATYRDPLGRISILAVVPVSRAGGEPSGAVVLLRPLTEVTRSTRDLFLLVLEGSLAGLGLSLLVSLVLARNLTRPLKALEAAAGRVAAGDFGQRLPVAGQDELGRVAASFNAMAERLGQLQRERQDLYASVSHELRTPITSIKGFAEAIKDNVGGPDERRRHAAIILEESSRLERLVNDLFQLARLEARQVDFEWRTVDLGELVLATVEKHEPQARAAQVALTADIALRPGAAAGAGPDLRPAVRGDPDRLSQVLANLVENALRFTPAGGRIAISCGRRGQMIAVSVEDSGPGIPGEDLERVFDRFYTVDRSRARAKAGTGLGLAIAKEIVSAHEGRIFAGRSELGGAKITFVLPELKGPGPLTPGQDDPPAPGKAGAPPAGDPGGGSDR